jgi:hypothetical protein
MPIATTTDLGGACASCPPCPYPLGVSGPSSGNDMLGSGPEGSGVGSGGLEDGEYIGLSPELRLHGLAMRSDDDGGDGSDGSWLNSDDDGEVSGQAEDGSELGGEQLEFVGEDGLPVAKESAGKDVGERSRLSASEHNSNVKAEKGSSASSDGVLPRADTWAMRRMSLCVLGLILLGFVLF